MATIHLAKNIWYNDHSDQLEAVFGDAYEEFLHCTSFLDSYNNWGNKDWDQALLDAVNNVLEFHNIAVRAVAVRNYDEDTYEWQFV
jgi:hypothetical protein